MTEPCKCPTIQEGMICTRRCLEMNPKRWWQLCHNECPPEAPCNDEDSLAVRKHCDERNIPPEERKKLTLVRRLEYFIKAMAVEMTWRAGGGSIPTLEEKTKRRNICNNCDDHSIVDDSCTLCGCFLEAGLLPPRPLGKLDCATQSCPKRLWGTVGGAKPFGCGKQQEKPIDRKEVS